MSRSDDGKFGPGSPTIIVTPGPADVSDDALLAANGRDRPAELITMIAMFHCDGNRPAAVALLRAAAARLEDQ